MNNNRLPNSNIASLNFIKMRTYSFSKFHSFAWLEHITASQNILDIISNKRFEGEYIMHSEISSFMEFSAPLGKLHCFDAKETRDFGLIFGVLSIYPAPETIYIW